MPATAMMLSGAPTGGSGAFAGHITVTVDHTKAGSTNSTDFPTYLTITDARLKTVANGGSVTDSSGHDIVIAANTTGTSLLKWRVLKYDGAAGTFSCIAKLPTLAVSVDTVYFVPFGNAAITTFQGDVSGTWNSDFKTRIWGSDGTTLKLTDDTTNANNGTNNNTAVAIAGPQDGLGAISFTAASSQYITTANTVNIAHPMLECWVYLTAYPAAKGSLAGFVQGNGGGTADKDLMIDTTGHVSWYVFDTIQVQVTATAALSLNAWHHVVGFQGVVNGLGTGLFLVIDGVGAVTGGTSNGTTFTGYTLPGLQINGVYAPAGTPGTSTYMTSRVAELRLSDVPSSGLSWAVATFNNINDPSTFYALT